MMYNEFVKALRVRADCTDLQYGTGRERCTIGLMRDAADALEAAEKRIAELEAQLPDEHGRLVDADACSSVLRRLENEAKTYTQRLCYGYAARMFEEAFTIIEAKRKDNDRI